MEAHNEHVDVNCITEVELIYKNPVKPASRPKVTGAKAAYEILMQHWDEGKIELQEQFKVMLLNRGSKLLGIFPLSSGGVDATIVDRKLLFATALKSNASKIILAHNHPSGLLNPSTSDTQVTNQIVAAGKLLEIAVLDHLIVSRDGYYSFSDDGMI